jgi:hypothetical protein
VLDYEQTVMICNFDQRSQPSDQLRAKFEIALHAHSNWWAFAFTNLRTLSHFFRFSIFLIWSNDIRCSFLFSIFYVKIMNKKLSRQNWKSRRVRESITSERPHGAEPDGAFNNYLPPPTIPNICLNLPRKKKDNFCRGLSDYVRSVWGNPFTRFFCK